MTQDLFFLRDRNTYFYERKVKEMKQYFIGINKRTKELLIGLLDLGATLMFYYHPITLELNKKYNFYDGKWMLLTDTTTDGSTIKEIEEFLSNFDDLNYKIIFYQEL